MIFDYPRDGDLPRNCDHPNNGDQTKNDDNKGMVILLEMVAIIRIFIIRRDSYLVLSP